MDRFVRRLARRTLLVPALLAFAAAAAAAEPERPPNLLLIVADDLGFSDLGCYGGEIATPHLDRLARGGVRLSAFYTTGRCCPSRAALMTGRYPHAVGLGHMTQDLGPNRPGYRGRIDPGTPTLADRLKARGYRTFLAGKWHLGTPDPTAHGFDGFYGTLVSAKTFWDRDHFTAIPRTAAPPAKDTAGTPFYGTDALTDAALAFLAESDDAPERPWLLTLAYNAPHFPLHAPAETVAKYVGRYDAGWDAVRAERLARMKREGVVLADTPLSPRSTYRDWGAATAERNPAWASLPADRRADLARRMAIYAAMIDRMDAGVGRVLTALEERGELDRTLIVFTSDNGACAEWDPFGFDGRSGPRNVLHTGDELAAMGSPGTFHSVGSGWANASNAPWRLYKHYAHEGGVAVPCIVHWPGRVADPGRVEPAPAHLVDLLPTLLDAADGGEAEVGEAEDGAADGGEELDGVSLLPVLRGESPADRTIFFEHEGHRGLRTPRWKLVALRDRPWELYDAAVDRTEGEDLAARRPDLVAELAGRWDRWAAAHDVTPLPDDYQVAYLNSDGDAPAKSVTVGPVRKLAGGFGFTEGPVWDGRGGWLFSDLKAKTLHRLSPDGTTSTLRTNDAFSNGAALDATGNLLFCEVSGRRIVRRAPDGTETTLADRLVGGERDGTPLGMPNDLWIAPDGAVYFTLPAARGNRAEQAPPGALFGAVCRVSPDGRTVTDLGGGVTSPNGVAGSADGAFLYVADPGAKRCVRFALGEDGALSGRTTIVDHGSDGLALDERDTLYVTGPDGVELYSPDAQRLEVVPVPERPANMTFGGPDGRTLFVTARTGVYAVDLRVRGQIVFPEATFGPPAEDAPEPNR